MPKNTNLLHPSAKHGLFYCSLHLSTKQLLIVILFSILNFNTNSQNLVSNPNFENLDTYNNLLNWRHLGQWRTRGVPQLSFPKEELIDGCMQLTKKDYAHPNCEKFEPLVHKNTLPLFCISGCSHDLNPPDELGCAIYANQKLNKPLEIGETYKISYWVYALSLYSKKGEIHDENKHLGVLLTNKQVRYNLNTESIIRKNALIPTSDSIILDKWVKKEIFITPTCELNYLTIGVFRESNWINPTVVPFYWFYYFLDDVAIEKITPSPNQAVNPNYYCNETEKEEPYETLNFDTNIQFDYNADNIKNPLQLDTFAQHALKHKDQIYYLSGHSDKTGINKLEISKKRVESVVKYIQERYKIPKHRLITGYFGDKYAINTPNDAINRRVHITASPIPKSMACYREALQQIKLKNYDAAMNMLNCWVTNGGDDDKILVYFDPAINNIRKHKGWKVIDSNVRKRYKKYKDPIYAFLLDSLYLEDQKYRGLTSHIQDLAGYNAEIDTTEWQYPSISVKELNKRDSLIYIQITALINKYGYPKQGEVGRRAAKGVAEILIHSHNIPSIKKYLPILEAYCKEGDGDWGHYAMLYDKLCTLEEKVPQRYGTQFVGDTNGAEFMTLYKYESKEAVNEARRKIALPPLNDEYFAMKIPTNQRFQGVK
jgi:outer membrane protein OmpA-like peptidoglycan-associated protein